MSPHPHHANKAWLYHAPARANKGDRHSGLLVKMSYLVGSGWKSCKPGWTSRQRASIHRPQHHATNLYTEWC